MDTKDISLCVGIPITHSERMQRMGESDFCRKQAFATSKFDQQIARPFKKYWKDFGLVNLVQTCSYKQFINESKSCKVLALFTHFHDGKVEFFDVDIEESQLVQDLKNNTSLQFLDLTVCNMSGMYENLFDAQFRKLARLDIEKGHKVDFQPWIGTLAYLINYIAENNCTYLEAYQHTIKIFKNEF